MPEEPKAPADLIESLRSEFRAEMTKMREEHVKELEARDATIAELTSQTETLKDQLVRETVQAPEPKVPEMTPEERERQEYAALLEQRASKTLEILKQIG